MKKSNQSLQQALTIKRRELAQTGTLDWKGVQFTDFRGLGSQKTLKKLDLSNSLLTSLHTLQPQPILREIICDKSKLSDKGCNGAPDFIIEIVSPSSRKMDYITKNTKYSEAGVREYWIVDPEKERTTVYHYEKDVSPTIILFSQPLNSGIYSDLSITISELLK